MNKYELGLGGEYRTNSPANVQTGIPSGMPDGARSHRLIYPFDSRNDRSTWRVIGDEEELPNGYAVEWNIREGMQVTTRKNPVKPYSGKWANIDQIGHTHHEPPR